MQVRCSNNISTTLESFKCVKPGQMCQFRSSNLQKCGWTGPIWTSSISVFTDAFLCPWEAPLLPQLEALFSAAVGQLGSPGVLPRGSAAAFQDISNTCRAGLHPKVCVLDPSHERTEKTERVGEKFCEVFPPSVIQLDIHLEKTGLCEGNFYEAKCVDSFEMKSSRGSQTHSDKVPQGMSLETNIRLRRRQKEAQKTMKMFG